MNVSLEELQELRREHQPSGGRPERPHGCIRCGPVDWPCPALRALDELHRLLDSGRPEPRTQTDLRHRVAAEAAQIAQLRQALDLAWDLLRSRQAMSRPDAEEIRAALAAGGLSGDRWQIAAGALAFYGQPEYYLIDFAAGALLPEVMRDRGERARRALRVLMGEE